MTAFFEKSYKNTRTNRKSTLRGAFLRKKPAARRVAGLCRHGNGSERACTNPFAGDFAPKLAKQVQKVRFCEINVYFLCRTEKTLFRRYQFFLRKKINLP